MKNIPIQPLCDTAMLALFLLLMADRHMENAFHEWLGVILLALLCLHTWLNWKWYALLLHGCYPLRRSIRLILNLLLLAAFSGTVATATFLSKTVFAFLALKGELLARTLHVCCAHWSFVLASFHLGLYWNTFWSSCKHISWLRLFSLNKALGVCLSLVIVFYGVWAFLQRNLLDPLMLRSAFMFWTEQDNLWKMLYDYATIFFTGAWLVHTIVLVKKEGNALEHEA